MISQLYMYPLKLVAFTRPSYLHVNIVIFIFRSVLTIFPCLFRVFDNDTV